MNLVRLTGPGSPPPQVGIEFRLACATWRGAVPGLGGLARRAVRAALAVAPPLPEAPQAELCVVFADDAAMRDLNRRFRNKDAPTNVLAFAAQETAAGARPATAPAEGVLLLGDRKAHV